LALCCLLALVASMPGRPGLGDPLWTGSVSLNGFSLGPRSLYVWRLDGKAVSALDLLTGRPRWSRDITQLPDSVEDLGTGVAVVMTRPLPGDGPGQPATITLVRDATGELITQTVGDAYLPSVDGRLLLVFSTRSRDPDSCAAPQPDCVDLTAWDASAGTVVWRLNLAPNTNYLPSLVDGRVEALVEVDTDGVVRLRDVSTGAVVGTTTLAAGLPTSGRQVALFPAMLLTAQRSARGIALTAYRRPALGPTWSVLVSDATPINDQQGGLYLWQCGPDACMTVNGGNTRVINQSTGSVTPPIPFQVIQRLGGGVFLASPQATESQRDGTGTSANAFIVDPAGRTLATLAVDNLVDWADSGDRGLVTQEGPGRTGFLVIDSRGNLKNLGSVAGTGLICHARADILACSDPGGTLRVWRLP
jgi:hypothetical protein